MKRSTNAAARILALLLASQLATAPLAAATSDPPTTTQQKELLPPAAIGWGNLLVPGLGATLSDRPVQGLAEAGLEIGTFYSGTLLATEGRFKIDGSVLVPPSGNVGKAVTAQILQQFGLKYHFYNTFYHYQQAVLAEEEAGHPDHNPQPIYRGEWKDMLEAPFKWENISSPWTWAAVLAVSSYLIWDYSRDSVVPRPNNVTPLGRALYGVSSIAVVPVGSSFGEDPLFRGFIQREVYGMTGSLPLGIATQSALFAMLHEDHLTSGAVGIYFGIEADQLHGNLGPAMAAHFWINVVIGLIDYWQFKRSLGISAPFNPPLSAEISIPF